MLDAGKGNGAQGLYTEMAYCAVQGEQGRRGCEGVCLEECEWVCRETAAVMGA
jgi:hypothetical protein